MTGDSTPSPATVQPRSRLRQATRMSGRYRDQMQEMESTPSSSEQSRSKRKKRSRKRKIRITLPVRYLPCLSCTSTICSCDF